MTVEEYDALPQYVRDVLDKGDGDESYDECEMIKADLNEIGWTCDYDLGGVIFDVKPIPFTIDLEGLKTRSNSKYLIVDMKAKTIKGDTCQSMNKIDIELKRLYPLVWLQEWIEYYLTKFDGFVLPEYDNNNQNSILILSIIDDIENKYQMSKQAKMV